MSAKDHHDHGPPEHGTPPDAIMHAVLHALEKSGLLDAIARLNHTFTTHLQETESRIMTAISDFFDVQTQHNTSISTAVDGLTGDVASMKALIEQLQNNPGPISPADQALLDQLQAVSAQVDTKLAALDALTPPTIPTNGNTGGDGTGNAGFGNAGFGSNAGFNAPQVDQTALKAVSDELDAAIAELTTDRLGSAHKEAVHASLLKAKSKFAAITKTQATAAQTAKDAQAAQAAQNAQNPQNFQNSQAARDDAARRRPPTR